MISEIIAPHTQCRRFTNTWAWESNISTIKEIIEDVCVFVFYSLRPVFTFNTILIMHFVRNAFISGLCSRPRCFQTNSISHKERLLFLKDVGKHLEHMHIYITYRCHQLINSTCTHSRMIYAKSTINTETLLSSLSQRQHSSWARRCDVILKTKAKSINDFRLLSAYSVHWKIMYCTRMYCVVTKTKVTTYLSAVEM